MCAEQFANLHLDKKFHHFNCGAFLTDRNWGRA
uniref:Hypotheticial protein n=1 Tax=Schistosoma japonicum TaxID=6182 RepID=C7TZ92_SCHJA|nr:hypotheticial protein [Schistosoma japonicum]